MSDNVPGGSSPPPPPPQPAPARQVDLGLPGVVHAVEIGRGAAGVVYRAEQPGVDRLVAVKMLPFAAMDEAARQRFERECRAMGSLSSHPGIVTVYDAGFSATGQPYIIMELMEGGSLDDLLRSRGRLSWEETVEIGIRLAGALEAAHGKGVLHRDVKPDNVLISSYGEPKLADFSIARVGGASLTQTGMVSATPAHAAPEILRGDPPTAVADVYSLASTLLTLVLGAPAFVRPTDSSIYPVLTRVERDPVPDVRPLGVPDPVARALERAMSKDPAARPGSAVAFASELAAARDAARAGGLAWTPPAALGATLTGFAPGSPPPAAAVPVTSHPATPAPAHGMSAPPPPGSPPPPRRGGGRMALVAVAAVVLVGGGAGGVVLATRGSSSPTASGSQSASHGAATSPEAVTSSTSTPPASASSTDTGLSSSSSTAGVGGSLTVRLLTASEVGSGYAQGSTSPADLASLNLCGITSSTAAKTDESDTTYQSLDASTASITLVVDDLATFPPGGAAAFLAAVETASRQCHTFQDGGADNTITVGTGPTIGDQTVRFHIVSTGSGVTLEGSYVLLRRGDTVALVAVTSSSANLDATAERLAATQLAKLA